MPRVSFRPDGRSATVAVGSTLLQAAEAAGAVIPTNCGGSAGCGTCHVYVERGLEFLADPEEDEEDALDRARGLRPSSRLACCARIAADGDIEVVIPPA